MQIIPEGRKGYPLRGTGCGTGGTMEIEGILGRVDQLYEQNLPEEAEGLLLDAAAVAVEERDDVSLLKLLNELLGHYRETSQWEKAYGIAEKALMVAENVCLPDSIPYATTLLNIATVYRTGGRLGDAAACYRRVEEIYDKSLPKDSMLRAGLYNNESLLCQEMGDFEGAAVLLQKALGIAMENGKAYEEAVTRANLAGTYVQLGALEEAKEQALLSVRGFEELGVEDQHLCAALSALGSLGYIRGQFREAAEVYRRAMAIMERSLGRNAYYERLAENYEACEKALQEAAATARGMELCRGFYEEVCRPMIREQFPEYEGRIAAGLVGEGSDAFGWDDDLSADHDWGPSLCLWVTEETYEKIGEKLQAAYEQLPATFRGISRAPEHQGRGRRGVQRIGDFYRRFVGTDVYEEIDWRQVPDASLAAAVNGEVFRDDEGIFSAFREKLKKGYPEPILYAKLAEGCARFAQAGQYNYPRMARRGDEVILPVLLGDALREAMRIGYYLQNAYPPHDKWLSRGLQDLDPEVCRQLSGLLRRMAADPGAAEEVGAYLAMELYRRDYLSDIDPYLDHQTEELLEKSVYANETDQELAMRIAKLEFEAFDKVQNEGGRASCQDDWPTFSIMRRSQYLTWTRTMLLQYLYDFHREMRLGHNLITEKYGRMMQSTAPERYEELKGYFPELTPEKQAIIEQIVGIQVDWMEDFSRRYPALGQQARTIRTRMDNAFDTSYETYLRGELGTYSDKMLELYARFIVVLTQEGRNLAEETMTNSARLYGYQDLAHAEEFLRNP